MYNVYIYVVEKKENALIIHSAREKWKGNTLLSEISSFYAYALFRKFRTPLTQSQLGHCVCYSIFRKLFQKTDRLNIKETTIY